MDYLLHSVVSSLPLLCWNRLLHDWSFCLNHYTCYSIASNHFPVNVVCPYGVVLSCYSNRFSFSYRLSLFSHVQVLLRESSLGCRLKYPYSCFSSNFCFQVIVLLLILVLFFYRCNQSLFFFMLFQVVVSMYRQ